MSEPKRPPDDTGAGPPPPVPPAPDPDAFAVVGIGVSVQGLDGLASLFGEVTTDSTAYLVVPARDVEDLGAVRKAISSATKLPVVDIVETTPLAPNHVFLAPLTSDVTLYGKHFHLVPNASPMRLPIDHALRSLAATVGPLAIGVVLGGDGSDGAFGLDAIRASGGITYLDEHHGRLGPREVADARLSPSAIGDELMRLSVHPYPRRSIAQRVARLHQEELGKLFVLIRSAFGTDLTYYKHTTIERRIERRMVLHRFDQLVDYVGYVHAHPDELATLYKDCLIGVTSFFRDHEPFELLKSRVFPALFERRAPTSSFRAWIPGCSTGEEAYSIAIVLLEYLEGRGFDGKLQLFASDLDEDAVTSARRGVYPANIAQDVSPARLQRFFVKRDGDYHIARRLRDMVVFAAHDVTRDPPFSRVDLISCRNVLIYLQNVLQRKVLRIFHYALNDDGYLLLGSSETIGDATDLFSVQDKQQKLYTRKHAHAPGMFEVKVPQPSRVGRPEPAPRPLLERRPVASIHQLADRKLLDRYAPPGVLVTEAFEVLQFRGKVGPFLDPTPGAASLNLLRLARPELVVELRTSILRALAEQAPVIVSSVHLRGDPAIHVRVEVIPIHEHAGGEVAPRCVLVLFERLTNEPPAEGVQDEETKVTTNRVRDLERELVTTKEYLQHTIEELEALNEELKASNEELQSSNEELQSTNEELETSKEELQSTNEELNTVNDELQTRMIELSQSNDDLQNFLGAATDPVVILGPDLRIRRFTSAAELLFGLMPADIGRSVSYLRAFFQALDFEKLVSDVVDRLVETRVEVQGMNERWYEVRLLPYRTGDHAIRGVVIWTSDVDDRRRRDEGRPDPALLAAMAALPTPTLVVDADLRVRWASDSYYGMFGTTAADTVGNLLHYIGRGQWAHQKVRKAVEVLAGDGDAPPVIVIDHLFEGVIDRPVTLTGSRVAGPDGQNLAVVQVLEVPAAARAPG